jgi:hypothetical protein
MATHDASTSTSISGAGLYNAPAIGNITSDDLFGVNMLVVGENKGE